MRATTVRGTITLTDGTISEFQIGTDGGWIQWGATESRLGESVGVLEAMTVGLLDQNLLVSDYDDEEQ